MRFPTLFLLVVGAAALGAIGWVFWRATAGTREWKEIQSWSGKDIHRADEKDQARLQAILEKRIPYDKDKQQAPWRVLILDGPDSSRRVVVFDANLLRPVPSAFALRIAVFNGEGRLLSDTPSFAGWRIDAAGVQGASQVELGPWSFEILSGPDINGADIRRQIYSLVEDQPALVRIEATGGRFFQNNYEFPNHTIGPPVPKRTPEAWEQALSSTDLGELLRSLVWLGGRHAAPTRSDTVTHREELDAVKVYYDTRSRPGVQERVSDLTQSSHPWVAEAAKAALNSKNP